VLLAGPAPAAARTDLPGPAPYAGASRAAPSHIPAPSMSPPVSSRPAATTTPKTPLVVVVSLKRQRLAVYDATGRIAESPISSGRRSDPTPTGVFSVIGKAVDHVSNLYEGAEMPFMQRLTWTGTALHAGHLPGYPASHGCIRLPHAFAERLYAMTAINTRVVVTDGEVAPVPIAHAKLFTPLPVDPEVPVADATIGSRIASLAPITVAYAAAPRPVYVGEVTLTPAARARFAATRRLHDAIAPLDAARTAIAARIADANVEIAGAYADVAPYDAAVRTATARLAALHRKRAGVQAELMAVIAKVQRARSDAAMVRLARAEVVVEARLFEVGAEIEAAEADLAAARAARAGLDTAADAALARRAALYREADAADAAVAAARKAFETARLEDARYLRPVSVFVSRKDKRVYVRQGFEPVLDLPVEIAEPDRSLGTHVYTAMARREGSADLDWTVVSLATGGKARSRFAQKPRTLAAGALDRITFPEAALDAIRERIKPGSSLIVSDEGTSAYFGSGTDFIVDTR
jgi:hypothetical protein